MNRSNSDALFGGFCFKEGSIRKSWKRRYFRITDEVLAYGRSSNKKETIADIPLASIISCTDMEHNQGPVEFRKFGFVVLIKSKAKLRYLNVCAENESERSMWITLLDPKKRKNWKPKKRHAWNVKDLFEEFKGKVLRKDYYQNSNTYRKSFRGSDGIDAMMEILDSNTRFESFELCQNLINKGIIVCFGQNPQSLYRDDLNSFYGFSDKALLGAENIQGKIYTSKKSQYDIAVETDPKDISSEGMEENDIIDLQEEPLEEIEPLTEPKRKNSNALSSHSSSSGDTVASKEKQKKIRTNVKSLIEVMELYSQTIKQIENLLDTTKPSFLSQEKRLAKMERRKNVMLNQRKYILQGLDSTEKNLKRKLRKRSKDPPRGADLQKAAQDTKSVLDKLSILLKVKQQFSGYETRYASIMHSFEQREKTAKKPKLHLLIELENDWDEKTTDVRNKEDDESLPPTIQVKQRTRTIRSRTLLTPKDLTKGSVNQASSLTQSTSNDTDSPIRENVPLKRRTHETKESNSDPDEDGLLSSTAKKQLYLSKANSDTINILEELEKERLIKLLDLEADVTDLTDCIKDIHSLIHAQQAEIDRVEKNVQDANRSLEQGIENVKGARNNLSTSLVKDGINKKLKLMRWISGA